MTKAPLPEQNPAVRRTLPEHFIHKDFRADTAGIPWQGRDYSQSPFPEDTGERVETVQRALDAVDAGADASLQKFVAALRGTRVLIPIQAIATDTALTASGLHADNASDMAMVKIELPTGEVALPIFTSVEALSAWNPQARPVPMVIEQAAQSAVAEGCTMLAVDLGREQPITLSRSMLWAIGLGREWIAPHKDPVLTAEVAQIPRLIEAITAVQLLPDTSREVALRLTLIPGLDRQHVHRVLAEVQAFLAHSQPVAERVSSLKISLQ